MEGRRAASPRTLWSRLLVTLAIIVIYRLGVWIPLPGIDLEHLQSLFQQLEQLGQFWSAFTGGAIERLSVFALGLIPYLNAAIVYSLIAFRSSKLRQLFLAQDAQFSWGLWALALLFSVLQAAGTSVLIVSQGLTSWPSWAFYLVNVPVLTAGVFVLIWLGGLITRYGIGHGWAILIAVGLLSDWPRYGAQITYELQDRSWVWGLGLVVLVVLVLAVSVWAFASSRRLGDGTVKLPFLAVGIIPLEWAAFLLVPVSLGFSGLVGRTELPSPGWFQDLARDFAQGGWAYMIGYGVLVLLVTYFYKNAIFQTQSATPSISALGAGLFLVAIALLPLVLTRLSGLTAYFLGGTGVLILTGVLWDAYRRARMDLPCVGVYRTFSHLQAHEVRTQLEGAGIPSVLQTPVPYPYSVYPMLGPVEIAVPERERARAAEITQTIGPERRLSLPPWERWVWAVLVALAIAIPLVGIGLQISVWPDVATPTALAVLLAGLSLFWWLRQSYWEYAHWFLMALLLIVALLYNIAAW